MADLVPSPTTQLLRDFLRLRNELTDANDQHAQVVNQLANLNAQIAEFEEQLRNQRTFLVTSMEEFRVAVDFGDAENSKIRVHSSVPEAVRSQMLRLIPQGRSIRVLKPGKVEKPADKLRKRLTEEEKEEKKDKKRARKAMKRKAVGGGEEDE